MTNTRISIATLLLLSPFVFAGCGGPNLGTINFNDPSLNPTVTVTPQIQTLAVGASQTFAATTGNASQISWVMVDSTLPDSPGTLSATGTPGTSITANGPTVTYTAPATPPTYGLGLATPGTVTVRTISGLTSVDRTFTITAPSITVGIHPPVSTTVKLGATLILNAYSVGNLSNGLNLQVNGVTGGSTAFGSIAAIGGIYGQYQYTAPTAMPMTGNTVTITAISTADPTKTATLTLTLQ